MEMQLWALWYAAICPAILTQPQLGQKELIFQTCLYYHSSIFSLVLKKTFAQGSTRIHVTALWQNLSISSLNIISYFIQLQIEGS